jgi:phosphoglycolate phosphatase
LAELIIFDLDGTLIDSKLDLAHAVNAARTYMELPPLEHERIYSYVGNGAPVLIRRVLGPEVSQADVDRALRFFLDYYRDHMLDYTTLYPGVAEVLDELRRHRRLAVLTNKPHRISEAIIQGLGLGDHFFRVYGGNSFEQKKPHPVGITTLMEQTAVAAHSTLMVGDSSVDIQTARNAGVRSVGVTYGFQPETLVTHPPDYLIDRMEQLMDIVNGAPAPDTA